MNSNWSRLKRKLDENKKRKRPYSSPPIKRRKPNKKTPGTNETTNPNPSLLTKYSAQPDAASSNAASHVIASTTEHRRQTPINERMQCLSLLPPASLKDDMAKRKAWWQQLRLKLRLVLDSLSVSEADTIEAETAAHDRR